VKVAPFRALLGPDLANHLAGIACGQHAAGNIPCHDAAGTDDGTRSDSHARQDDRAPTNLHVRANLDWFAELFAPPLLGLDWMPRCVDLDCRAEQGKIADADLAHVQDHAVEVEEHALAELDIRAVVAEERRLHPHRATTLAEQRAENAE
jgi:hypothetical protein